VHICLMLRYVRGVIIMKTMESRGVAGERGELAAAEVLGRECTRLWDGRACCVE
jgi:hypothetical protein